MKSYEPDSGPLTLWGYNVKEENSNLIGHEARTTGSVQIHEVFA